MIRVRRPTEPPAILRGRGRALRRRLCAAYARAAAAYEDQSRTFSFEKAVYAAPEVKAALIAAQHDKCCFCESKISHVSFGDVEHFRPKAAWRQAPGEPLQTPGYYWLAYEWDNLLFCCELCNRRHKESCFPLAAPAARARSHRDSCDAEAPLFLDPCADDPAEHVSFRAEYPYAVHDSARGAATLAALGLATRVPLIERRRDRLQTLRSIFDLARCAPDAGMREQAAALLLRLTADSAEYAAMARAAVAAWEADEALAHTPPRRTRKRPPRRRG